MITGNEKRKIIMPSKKTAPSKLPSARVLAYAKKHNMTTEQAVSALTVIALKRLDALATYAAKKRAPKKKRTAKTVSKKKRAVKTVQQEEGTRPERRGE